MKSYLQKKFPDPKVRRRFYGFVVFLAVFFLIGAFLGADDLYEVAVRVICFAAIVAVLAAIALYPDRPVHPSLRRRR